MDEAVVAQTIVDAVVLTPDTEICEISENSTNGPSEFWADHNPLTSGGDCENYSASPTAANVLAGPVQSSQVKPAALRFSFGSPPDDPSTLFFDDSANIWDLPDNLNWFFEPSQQEPLMVVADNSFTSLQAPAFSLVNSLPPTSESTRFSPMATEACWSSLQLRLLDSLCMLPQEILHSNFFEPSSLAASYNLYFENYHPHFPIFHRPTLFVLEAEPLLIASIITLGSTLASDDEIYNTGQKIHDSLRWIIFQVSASDCAANLVFDNCVDWEV